jgi:hypothetical protein
MVMALGFFAMIAVTVRNLAGVWSKRIDARRAESSVNAIDERLARIETAVDVIALEVERIAEAQRFAARLEAERDARLLARPHAGEGRVVTPH